MLVNGIINSAKRCGKTHIVIFEFRLISLESIVKYSMVFVPKMLCAVQKHRAPKIYEKKFCIQLYIHCTSSVELVLANTDQTKIRYSLCSYHPFILHATRSFHVFFFHRKILHFIARTVQSEAEHTEHRRAYSVVRLSYTRFSLRTLWFASVTCVRLHGVGKWNNA